MAKQKKSAMVPENNPKKELSRRDFLKAGGAVIASAVLFNSLAACAPKTTTATTTATKTATTTATQTATTTATKTATSTATQTATQTATTTATTTVVSKILKIGIVSNFGNDVQLDAIRGAELMADNDNKNGGLTIGGNQYNIQIVKYDNQNSQTTEASAINRLVYEDQVKFIIAQGLFQGTWQSVTEDNKVLVTTGAVDTNSLLTPNYHYTFALGGSGTGVLSVVGWFCTHYADALQNYVLAALDNQIGHMVAGYVGSQLKAFGVTPKATLFFPESLQDLSAVATKVVSENPSAVTFYTLGTLSDLQCFNAVYAAGYRGMLFHPTFIPTQTLLEQFSSGAEGFMCVGYPTEFAPPLTQAAKDFIALWKAKYGSFSTTLASYPESYCALRTALPKAGSVDSDKVAEVLAGGMAYSAPNGECMTISRPDLGNDRCVDSIFNRYIKQIKGGQATIVATIPIDEGLSYFRKANPPLPPGATYTPPSGPS